LNFEQGDILVANITYSEHTGFKKRPILVISNNNYNKTSGDLIVLSISSQKPKVKYDIKLTNNDLIQGQLKAESKILIDFITTLDKSLVDKKIAKINNKKINEVKKRLKELFNL